MSDQYIYVLEQVRRIKSSPSKPHFKIVSKAGETNWMLLDSTAIRVLIKEFFEEEGVEDEKYC